MKKLIISLFALFMVANVASSQVAIRTNIATMPFGVPTLGVEFGLGQKWSLGFDVMANVLNIWPNEFEMTGGLIMGELRYYFCETFNKHHLGLYGMFGYHTEMGFYNELASKIIAWCPEHGRDGEGKEPFHLPNKIEKVKSIWGGLSYGYYIKLGHGWGLDLSIGGGVSWALYRNPGDTEDNSTDLHFGLNRLGIDLSYKF